ncbi:recombinase RecQ, partial [Streptomyces sp. NPDC059037]
VFFFFLPFAPALAPPAPPPGGRPHRAPPPPRPAGVVTMTSHTRPQLIQSLGSRIAEIGRLPLLGSIEYAVGADTAHVPRSNSAQRLRALDGTLTVPPALAATLRDADGPVLLVDDLTDSGWTLAVAARMLRRAGATGVLPLVLAVQG